MVTIVRVMEIRLIYSVLCLIVKVSSYIAQYPILRIVHSAFLFTALADLFNQTPFQLLWEASSHTIINARRLFLHTSTTIYSQVLIYTAE